MSPCGCSLPAPRPELLADRDEVFAAIGDESVRLIDVMPEAHYKGEMVMYARPGHISTAENVPIMALLDETGRYRSKDELAALIGGDEGSRAITYCGGGIAASSTALVMTRLGYTDVAVYIGSLQEWAADPANPMEVSASLEAKVRLFEESRGERGARVSRAGRPPPMGSAPSWLQSSMGAFPISSSSADPSGLPGALDVAGSGY